MFIALKKLSDNAVIPKFSTPGSAGFDLYSTERVEVMPNRIAMVPTGLSVEFDPDYALLILPRSGLAAKGLGIANSPGLIDSDYRGEIKVLLYTMMDKSFIIEQGDRVAQGLLIAVTHPLFTLKTELSSTERGTGGFGSTGL